jgi:hypothetical protein
MIAEKAVAYSGGRVLIGGAGGYQPLVETPQTWVLVVETIYNNVNSALAELANQPAELANESAELAVKGKGA